MPSATLAHVPAAPPLEAVLWDVVEEHLDEAAFGLEQLETLLEHPTLTLGELSRYPEGRLLAHVEALVVGGDEVRERLLLPEIENANEDEPTRVTAATLALISAGRYELLPPVLSHEVPAVRAAGVRAAALHPVHAAAAQEPPASASGGGRALPKPPASVDSDAHRRGLSVWLSGGVL